MSLFIDADFAKLVDSSFLQTFLDTVFDGVVIRSAEGRFVAFNEAALRLLGATRGQLLQQEPPHPCWRAVMPDGSAVTAEHSPAMIAIRTGQPSRQQLMRVHLADGTLHWLSVSASPLRTAEGRVVAAITTYSDVTESRRATELAAVQEARMAAMLDGSEHGTFEWDLVEDHVARSRHVYAMLGFRPGEIGTRGGDWFARIHEEDRPGVIGMWDEIRAGTREVFDLEYRMRHREGKQLWVRSLARVIRRDTKGRGQRVTGTVQDVTSRREAQEALKAVRDRVEELEARLSSIPC